MTPAIGPAARGFRLDVTQEEAWRSVSLESRVLGEVDIVINNAGYFPSRSIDELDLAQRGRTITADGVLWFLNLSRLCGATIDPSVMTKATGWLDEIPRRNLPLQENDPLAASAAALLAQWEALVALVRLKEIFTTESDSVLASLNDPDFHLGGTNAKGFILAGNLGIARNTWVTAKWLSSTQVSGAPFAVDVIQADLNVKF